MTERGSPPLSEFLVRPEASAVLIEARSNVGPISFGTNELQGRLLVRLEGEQLVAEVIEAANLTVDLSSLTSGNALYDAELVQRLGVRRFPSSTVVLKDARAMRSVASEQRFAASGELNLHGVTRDIQGTLSVTHASPDVFSVSGEHEFDIRDFDIPTPSVLMLHIYPRVRVHLQLEVVAVVQPD
jgi:polyisoprenoid-binding protein YceI